MGDKITVHITMPDGIEALVCTEIAARAAMGKAKYGTTVAENPLELLGWLQHLKEELMDATVYVARAMVDIERGVDDGK